LTSREALRIFDLADIWARRTGNTVRMVSANDHVHARRSAHYAGFAVDLHSSNLDALAETMKSAGYRVLWKVPGHYTHVHVEDPGYQMKEESRALNPTRKNGRRVAD
jgi:hypothetical protein